MLAAVSGGSQKKVWPGGLVEFATWLHGERKAEDDDLVEELKAWGVDAKTIAEYRAQQQRAAEEAGFEIIEELWPPVEFYLRCRTQWVHAGMEGIKVGLNYGGVRLVMESYGYDARAFEGLQIIEMAALSAMHKARRENAAI
jgi:hypothetical protein